jgi:putative ABC transport system permease protein
MANLALKTLLHDKSKLAITLAGVAFAVTLVLVQVGLFLGLLDNASITIEKLPADLWVTAPNTPNVDFATSFSAARVDRVRSVPGVERADNLIVAFMEVALPTGALEGVQVYAMADLRAWAFPWHVTQGDVDDLRRSPSIFMDDSAEKRFGAFSVGEYREILGRRLKIVGRTREAKSFTTTPIVFMDLRLAQEMRGLAGQSNYIVARLAPGADVEAVRAEIKRRLPYNDVYTRAEWSARSRDYWIKSTGIGLNIYLAAFLGCLVGFLVVAQTLYSSTLEHLKEFGTVKAIGGGNGEIYKILCQQALMVAVGGFAAGVSVSHGLAEVVAGMDLRLAITDSLTAVVFGGALAVCLVAAVLSFRKVATIDPALVFRG